MTDINEAIQEMYQKSMQLQSLSYGDPGRAAARASATPQQMYADLAAQCRFNTTATTCTPCPRVRTFSSRTSIETSNKVRGSWAAIGRPFPWPRR